MKPKICTIYDAFPILSVPKLLAPMVNPNINSPKGKTTPIYKIAPRNAYTQSKSPSPKC